MFERFLPWLNWGITTTFVLFQFFMQATAGLMANRWANDFSISPTQVGNLSAAFFYSYVILQIPAGIAYDKIGVRKVVITASFLLAVGCFCIAVAQSYWLALLARLLMGTGSAFGFIGMLYVTAAWFSPKQFAVLVGIAETLAMAGVAVGEMGMASLIFHHGWRLTMVIAGIIAVMIHVLAICFIQERDTETIIDHSNEQNIQPSLMISIRYALTNRQVWLAGLYGFALTSIINVFASLWAVPYLRDTYQWLNLHGAASLVSMIFLGVAIGGPILAAISNRLNRRKTIMLFGGSVYFVVSLYFFIMPFTELWVLYVLMLLLGISASSYILAFALTKETTIEKYRGVTLSTMNMIFMSSGPILQPAIGFLLDMGVSFQKTMLIMPCISFLTLILFCFIREPKYEY